MESQSKIWQEKSQNNKKPEAAGTNVLTTKAALSGSQTQAPGFTRGLLTLSLTEVEFDGKNTLWWNNVWR